MRGVFSAALCGSVLIVFILALRRLFANRLPRRLFPALWCVAALRLLLPVELPTRLSFWNLLQGARPSTTGGAISEVLRPFPALASSASQNAAAIDAGRFVSPLIAVWLIGAGLLFLYLLVGYFCMTRSFRAAKIAPRSEIPDLLAKFHVSSEPNIRATKSRRAPLTFGVLRPTVLLPEDLRGEAFTLVLAHELAHVKARDCLKKVLFAACLCLYWWNPLVWRMVKAADEDLELSCDAFIDGRARARAHAALYGLCKAQHRDEDPRHSGLSPRSGTRGDRGGGGIFAGGVRLCHTGRSRETRQAGGRTYRRNFDLRTGKSARAGLPCLKTC